MHADATAVASAAPPRYTRANPFPARLVVNRRLSGPESEKDTRHFEIDLTGWGMEIIDFLVEHPSARFAPEEFVALLTKLQPRLYSVASSLRAYPDQVHFIVDVVRYESNGRIRKGVCSSFLAERADDVPVPVFPSVAKHFHLPDDPETPIIMI